MGWVHLTTFAIHIYAQIRIHPFVDHRLGVLTTPFALPVPSIVVAPPSTTRVATLLGLTVQVFEEAKGSLGPWPCTPNQWERLPVARPARMRLLNGRNLGREPCDLPNLAPNVSRNRDFDLKTCPIGHVSVFRGEIPPLQRPLRTGRTFPLGCSGFAAAARSVYASALSARRHQPSQVRCAAPYGAVEYHPPEPRASQGGRFCPAGVRH